MSGTDQLDTPLGNRPGSLGFQFPPDLINDDDFRVMVFDRFDHHLMLQRGLGDL